MVYVMTLPKVQQAIKKPIVENGLVLLLKPLVIMGFAKAFYSQERLGSVWLCEVEKQYFQWLWMRLSGR